MSGESRQQRRNRERWERKKLDRQVRRADQLRPMTELGETALDYALHDAAAGDLIVHSDDHLALVAVVMHTECLEHASVHLLNAGDLLARAAGE